MINSAIYNGQVIHKRFKPKVHNFRYKVFSLLIDLSELEKLDQNVNFFSINKFNLISFHEKDHGDRDGSSLTSWVKQNLKKNDDYDNEKITNFILNNLDKVRRINLYYLKIGDEINYSDLKNFDKNNDDDDTKIVLIVGRFDYNIIENHPQNHKNTAFTLGVLEQLVNKKVIFVYIGANDYSINEFYLLAEELNVLNKLKVLGIRNDVNFLMQQADLLFFPSREEGLGMVAVEAQVCGLKVLASDGVPNECVIDNKLVSFLPLSAPKVEWSRKIVELLNEENLDSELNKILFEFSEFNIQNAPKILNNLYLNEF